MVAPDGLTGRRSPPDAGVKVLVLDLDLDLDLDLALDLDKLTGLLQARCRGALACEDIIGAPEQRSASSR